jgi:hypothetical protein
VARSAIFTPDSTEWRQESALISAVRSRAGFQIKFEFRNGTSGNDLYLDDINIGTTFVTDLGDATNPGLALSVYPNPVDAESKIYFTTQTEQSANIQIFDALGRVTGAKTFNTSGANENTILISEIVKNGLTAGVYTVRVSSGSKSVTQKVTVLQ